MTIHLVSIHAFGRHGASPGERDTPQEFVIDVYDTCKHAGFSKIHFVPPPIARQTEK